MYSINEVNIDHINRLNDIQLSKLLHCLLNNEAEKNSLESYKICVPLKITVADGGEDGRIEWVGHPKATTKWLKNKTCLFQNKATDLPPSKCFEEILEIEVKNQPRKLKTQIEEIIHLDGRYILFTNRNLNNKQITERINEFRSAAYEAGNIKHSTFEVECYDANLIKDWTNDYVNAVTLVQEFNDIHRPGFMTWERLENTSKAHENEYQKDETISNNIKLIEESIKIERVLRISGHSGLGKTRLVIESFRNSNLKKLVVYYDLMGVDNIAEIKNYIISHQDIQDGIIIVDNCDAKSHNILSALTKTNGSLKIITIGLDDNNSITDVKIKLERNNQREIVKQIIVKKLNSHTQSDIEYVNKISEGYPWMAIRFCDSILKEGMYELSKYPMDEFIKKLIFGERQDNNEEYNVTTAMMMMF